MVKAAQAQAQRQEEITAQESLELCKALLRVSIFHVSVCWCWRVLVG